MQIKKKNNIIASLSLVTTSFFCIASASGMMLEADSARPPSSHKGHPFSAAANVSNEFPRTNLPATSQGTSPAALNVSAVTLNTQQILDTQRILAALLCYALSNTSTPASAPCSPLAPRSTMAQQIAQIQGGLHLIEDYTHLGGPSLTSIGIRSEQGSYRLRSRNINDVLLRTASFFEENERHHVTSPLKALHITQTTPWEAMQTPLDRKGVLALAKILNCAPELRSLTISVVWGDILPENFMALQRSLSSRQWLTRLTLEHRDPHSSPMGLTEGILTLLKDPAPTLQQLSLSRLLQGTSKGSDRKLMERFSTLPWNTLRTLDLTATEFEGELAQRALVNGLEAAHELQSIILRSMSGFSTSNRFPALAKILSSLLSKRSLISLDCRGVSFASVPTVPFLSSDALEEAIARGEIDPDFVAGTPYSPRSPYIEKIRETDGDFAPASPSSQGKREEWSRADSLALSLPSPVSASTSSNDDTFSTKSAFDVLVDGLPHSGLQILHLDGSNLTSSEMGRLLSNLPPKLSSLDLGDPLPVDMDALDGTEALRIFEQHFAKRQWGANLKFLDLAPVRMAQQECKDMIDLLRRNVLREDRVPGSRLTLRLGAVELNRAAQMSIQKYAAGMLDIIFIEVPC